MKKRILFLLHFSWIILNVFPCYSQNNVLELNGFFLGQYRKSVHAKFGAPIKRIDTEDKWIYEFHKLNQDTTAYALFKYSAKDTLRIYAIQINGPNLKNMYPFLGLVLGDSKEKVDKVLGSPYKTKVIDNPTVNVFYYANTNYSVEIDENDKLYGIQIYGGFEEKPKSAVPSIEPLKRAVLSKNIDSLLYYLSPDVEIYNEGKVISYSGSARDEFHDSRSAMVSLILGKKRSMWEVFEKEKLDPTPELRFFAELEKTPTVYKFYQSKIISEIVFMPYAGEWKVYEVTFR